MEQAQLLFHEHRLVFQDSGVRPTGFSLPRQHSLDHYQQHIRNFAAPNGLCTSITEAKHIKAVKEPWRRSNQFDALGQMLLTNQRLEKLAATRADLTVRGMLHGTCLTAAIAALAQEADIDGDDELQEGGGDDDDDDEDEEEELEARLQELPHQANAPELPDNEPSEQDFQDEPVGIDGVVEGPRVSGFVVLSRKPRMFLLPVLMYKCR